MYQHFLIPTDGTETASRAVREGAKLARSLGARITLVTVIAPEGHPGFASLGLGDLASEARLRRELADQILADAAVVAAAEGVVSDALVVTDDEPAAAIVEAARTQGCDLIAMASHGRRGVAALVLGSETAKVLTGSRIPVLVYR